MAQEFKWVTASQICFLVDNLLSGLNVKGVPRAWHRGSTQWTLAKIRPSGSVSELNWSGAYLARALGFLLNWRSLTDHPWGEGLSIPPALGLLPLIRTPRASPMSHPPPVPTSSPKATPDSTTCPWGPSGELSAQGLSSPSLFFAWKGIICSTHSSCLTIHNPRNVTSEHRHHTRTQLVLNRPFFLNNSFQLLSTYLKKTALSGLSPPLFISAVCSESQSG